MLLHIRHSPNTPVKLILIIAVLAGHFNVLAQKKDYFPFSPPDTLRSFLAGKNAPVIYCEPFRHCASGMGSKILRGTFYASAYNVIIGTGLTMSSERITQWHKKDKFSATSILVQYKKSFSNSPVIDQDLAIVDYVGHPYQGGFYYNSLRAQGGNEWQSAIFCFAQSTLWEYAWEGGIEQPSIQDLVVTPITGILLGEASHVLTIKMSKNGYRWYEKVIIWIINPAFAFNNGFRVTHDPW